MRTENEEIHVRSIQPMMARVGGVDFEGQKAVRVTITVLPQKGQTTTDIDLATASFIHAQELFNVLDRITDLTGYDPDLFEEATELLNDIRGYW